MTDAAKSPPKKDSPLTELPFSYPFRKPGEKDFTDEHEFHKLLADESTGFFPISDSGMWHGGIHVSAAGAGKQLDLKYGVRCIAKGDVVAYRVDSVYPVSELPAQDGLPTVNAPYSTGFALVRHSMEYPRGQKLTFFSLYMHLQSVEEYEKDNTLKKPTYWDLAYEISDSAVDRPGANANTGLAAPEEQVGLRVRAAPRRGQILAILPQGARLRIGEKKEKDLWGKIVEIESGNDMYPPQVGAYVADDAKTGWIFLGEEHGKPVVKQVLSDAQLDRVVILPKPFPINAGDLIGHLGQYDLLSPPTAGNRMVHIEVLCDEEVEPYLKQSRTYVDQHAKDEDHTIVRVDKQVKLYKKMGQEGASAPETGVVQIYPVSVLAAGKKEDQAQETVTGSDGRKAHWWMIDSADVRHASIEGWVRETNHAGGRVTLEAPHQWVDFKTLEEAHDPTHTMFASAQGWIDYKLDAPVPEVAALAKLSPAANEIYRAAYPTGSGAQAADELRKASKDKWRQLILSRLIVRHESEWANSAKWDSLFAQVEERTAHDPALDEEKKRIAKLVWWSDVAAGKIEGFPSSPEVFHIHPIGLLGNFVNECDCKARFTKISATILRHEGGFVNDPNDSGGATNKGIAWNTWQAYAKEDLGMEPTLENLKAITDDQARVIYLNRYWQPQGFCDIMNERVALMIYDWTITSGGAVNEVKKVLNASFANTLKSGSQITTEMTSAINSIENQDDLTDKIADSRKKYYTALAYKADGKPSKNHKFLKGWLSRVDDCLDYK
jgi:lysozyme family protein